MFYSILFPAAEQHEKPRRKEQPDCFKDLNLDQIFAPFLKSARELGLEDLYYTSLDQKSVILYRQNVMRELENDIFRERFTAFAKSVFEIEVSMQNIKKALASQYISDNNYLTRGRMLDCADRYCRMAAALAEFFSSARFESEGLRGFSEYLTDYSRSEAFRELRSEIKQLREKLATVKYCMLIKNGTVRVRKYEGQIDHSEQILKLFEKFRQGDVQDYRHKLSEEPYAAHVEGAVLNLVAGLYRDIFDSLNAFCVKYRDFPDDTILRFAREVQFYLSWLEQIRPLREAGLPFNYPTLCETPDHLYVRDGFDLALASLARGRTVPNDFALDAPERILVVTGPNQGGKTTFARAFGQMHWLASLGLCVPGRKAALYLFDHILTHFGREEDLSTLNGKLQDDLVRLHSLLERATGRSVIIVNEIFASTTLSDAIDLGKHMMDAIAALGSPAVVVTFLDELASHGAETVSMMSTVEKDDPAKRTYKVVRKPPDGLAYAIYLAGKHGLTYEKLSGRLEK